MVPTCRDIPPAKVPSGRDFGTPYGLSGGEGMPMHGLSGLEMGFGFYHLISNERLRRVFDSTFNHLPVSLFLFWKGEENGVCPDLSGHTPANPDLSGLESPRMGLRGTPNPRSQQVSSIGISRDSTLFFEGLIKQPGFRRVERGFLKCGSRWGAAFWAAPSVLLRPEAVPVAGEGSLLSLFVL